MTSTQPSPPAEPPRRAFKRVVLIAVNVLALSATFLLRDHSLWAILPLVLLVAAWVGALIQISRASKRPASN